MCVPAAAVTRDFLKYTYENSCTVQELSGKFEPVPSHEYCSAKKGAERNVFSAPI
jgi:hypothetical protein